jgi:nucleotidyltransferase AbiEii toxin of type IV toxin-antitoxin system
MAALSLAHPEALAPASQAALSAIGERPWCEAFYLAGSAALALYLGHRPVRDLDLMTGTNRLTGPERRDILADLLAADWSSGDPGSAGSVSATAPGAVPAATPADPGFTAPDTPGAVQVETARDGYLFARLPGNVGLRLFYYPYPLVDPCESFGEVEVASAVDLGLMKLGAIISRGSRRDFVDLYLLCRALPLAGLLDRADEKFGHVRDFPLQALKGLADLSEVDGEPMPRLARPLAWEEVEGWLLEEVRSLGRAHVGLVGDPR